jgi:hypothetical protein
LFLLEEGINPRWRVTVTGALIAFASLRFLRLWWLLSRVLEALARGSVQAQSEVVPWQQPLVKSGDYHLRRRKPQARAE